MNAEFRRAYTNDYPPEPVTWVDWVIALGVVLLWLVGFAVILAVSS